MGSSAPYAFPAAATVLSSLFSALSMPTDQELQSFADYEGNTNLHPRNMLGESRSQINDMISLLKSRANRPVSLRSSFVQQPPTFAGGGLPMPIGVAAQDPALANPDLLTLPGMSGVLVNDTVDRTGGDPRNPGGPRDPIDTDGDGDVIGDDPEIESGPMLLGSRSGNRSGVARRNPFSSASPSSSFARPSYSTNVSQHDDLAQGMGSIELLLRSLGNY